MSTRLKTFDYDLVVLENLKKKYGEKNISQSFLRMEQVITNSKLNYQFNVLVVGSETNTERKVDKNDSFVVTKLGLFIFERDTTTKDEGKAVLQTYPNLSAFTAGTNFRVADLELVYNGSLSIKRGTTVKIEALNTRRFREASQTQQSTANNKSSVNETSGFIPMTPAFTIPGQEQVEIKIDFPGFNGVNWQSDAENKEIRLALVTEGFLVKGVNAA